MICKFCGYSPKDDEMVLYLDDISEGWSGYVLVEEISIRDKWKCSQCGREQIRMD